MRFSATDAAFEGFRLVRRNPMALLAWTGLYLIVALVQIGAMAGMGSGLARMESVAETLESSPPQSFQDMAPLFQAYGEMVGGMAWIFPLSLAVSVVLSAAVARGVLFPQTRATFGYVRLGMDELRVAIVMLAIFVLTLIICCVVFLLVGILGGLAVSMIDNGGWVVMVLLFLAAMAFIVWLTVRWSLAVPITVAEKRIAVFDSFAVTRGRFWPLLGMAIITGVMALLVALLSMIVSTPLTIMSGLGMATAGDDPAAIFAAYNYGNPWVLASALVNAVIGALMLGVLYAPFSAAYRGLKGEAA